MKSFAALFAVAAFAASGVAQAQTCASPLTFPIDADGNYLPIYGDTCSLENSLQLVCAAVDSVENDAVVGFTVNPPSTGTKLTLTPTTPGWDPMILLWNNACGDNYPCNNDSDIGSPSNPAETLYVMGSGTYNLHITGSPGSLSCGGFMLTREEF